MMFFDEPPGFKYHLLRALYDSLLENKYTPYLLVDATIKGVEVPKRLVNSEGAILLDISTDLVRVFSIEKHALKFDACFGKEVFSVYLPIQSIVALYAKESPCGWYFDPNAEEGEPVVRGEEPSSTQKRSPFRIIQGGISDPGNEK